MRIVIDMNLSPDWVRTLGELEIQAEHWSLIGPSHAPDLEILKWARENAAVVLTQDLDFSQLLFSTQAAGPSVILLRMDNEFDPEARLFVTRAISQARESLVTGALLTISGQRARLRRLPMG